MTLNEFYTKNRFMHNSCGIKIFLMEKLDEVEAKVMVSSLINACIYQCMCNVGLFCYLIFMFSPKLPRIYLYDVGKTYVYSMSNNKFN